MIVIGLSGKARHGKGSVVQLAQILQQSGDEELEVKQVSFATALKQIAIDVVTYGEQEACLYLTTKGLPGHIARQVVEFARGLTIADLKAKTPHARKLLQFIGTEAFRKNVDDLYWVKLAARKIQSLSDAKVVFVPDCRFTNEADYVRSMGGEIWRIERYNRDGTPFDNKLTPEQKSHRSETELDDYNFDAVLKASDMDELFHAVEGELKRLGLF